MMAEGRRQHDWQQTSAVLSMLYNAHRDPKKSKPATPRDFDPTIPPAPKPVIPLKIWAAAVAGVALKE